jgi:hypothetical protein
MRGCAKTGCEQPATVSIGLRYGDRIVVVGDLTVRFDPNLLELCGGHADRLRLPRGWVTEDRRPADRDPTTDPSVEPPVLPTASDALPTEA